MDTWPQTIMAIILNVMAIFGAFFYGRHVEAECQRNRRSRKRSHPAPRAEES